MTLLRDASTLTWLGESPAQEGLTGFEHAVGETSTWILHAAYLDPGEADRPALGPDRGADDVGGAGSPDSQHPAPGWLRRRWAELPGMREPASLDVPPCFRWFSPGPWPQTLHGPCEGTLDEVSFRALLQVLLQHCGDGASTEVYAYYCPLITGDYDHPVTYRCRLGDLEQILSPRGPYDFTPSNLWPADRSWLVWTDYDLWASHVSGPRDLIDAVRRHPHLDTLSWQRPHPPG